MAMIRAVYDARDASWWGLSNEQRQHYNEWAREQGVPLDGRSVYRTEIHGTEKPFIRVYEYDLDEQGHKHLDPATDDVAKKAPHDHPITCLPPVGPAIRASEGV